MNIHKGDLFFLKNHSNLQWFEIILRFLFNPPPQKKPTTHTSKHVVNNSVGYMIITAKKYTHLKFDSRIDHTQQQISVRTCIVTVLKIFRLNALENFQTQVKSLRVHSVFKQNKLKLRQQDGREYYYHALYVSTLLICI